jgi:hypothetical protein
MIFLSIAVEKPDVEQVDGLAALLSDLVVDVIANRNRRDRAEKVVPFFSLNSPAVRCQTTVAGGGCGTGVATLIDGGKR